MPRRPTTIPGLVLRLLGRRPGFALGATALGSLVALSVALDGERPPERPAPPRPGPLRPEPSSPWIAPFWGEELLADGEHLYWTEARDREYDDRPIAISRAAVRRRAHEGGAVQTIFDFERDDTYCFPGALRFLHGRPAWHCRRPVLDGHGRADASRYAHVRDGARHEVPAPWAQPPYVAASGAEVTFLVSRSTPRLTHLNAVSGNLEEGVDLPPSYGSFASSLAGLTATAVIGRGRDEQGSFVWTAPRDGEGSARVLFRPPPRADLDAVLADDRGVYVSWDEDHGSCHLARLEGGEPRTLHRSTAPILGLLRVDDHLYFHTLDAIERLHIPTSRTSVVLRGARPGWGERAMAVGGGWLYWRDPDGLHRHRLP